MAETSHDITLPLSTVQDQGGNPPEHETVLRGIVYAMGAYLMLAVMNALAKYMSSTLGHHVIEIAFYRNFFAVLPILFYIVGTRKFHYFKTKKPRALAFRAVMGVVSLCVTFAAFQALPMAETTVLLFSSSLILPALSFFVLKESVGVYRWAAIFIGLCGVIIMAGPTGLSNMLGVALALTAASMHACLGLVLRYMKTESPVTVTFYFLMTGCLLTGALMPFFATVPTPFEWGMFFLIGMSGALGQIFLANAFKNASASVVSPFNYTGLIWASLFDIFLWHTMPGVTVYIGGAVVIGSSLFIAYRERLNSKKIKQGL